MSRTKKNRTTAAPTTSPSTTGEDFTGLIEAVTKSTDRLVKNFPADTHELSLPPSAPPAPVNPEVGDVVQVTAPKSKYIARVAIVYRSDKQGLLCYQPSGTTKPPSFLVKPGDVIVIGKAKLKWKKEL